MSWRLAGAMLLVMTMASCATRKLESCLAHLVMIGPGIVTVDCRPPLSGEP